ncbi:hypothetical protein DAH66_01660 [Sphingomonas koreensis]|uniref:Uncharacterized protein n=1 Tax=Sphingomonas koreensis TaxID=93064 RepID=A0A430G978_9SPHN|nr:hypothetical protein [Sphingomonas koreensis]RSY90701.1 hypothetical protein DAH66_01660 [Sphingomonas koreensis]
MHHISESAVTVVVGDTRAVLKATDETLLAHAHMLASVIEGMTASDLPISISQDLYARLIAHGGKIVEGREDLRQLISRLTAIKNESDQRELATGCPNGLPEIERATPNFFTGASLDAERQPA